MKNRHTHSLKGVPSAPITEPREPAVAETSSHSLEKTMEAVQEKNLEAADQYEPSNAAVTAKAMAAAEEANAARQRALLLKQQSEAAAEAYEPMTLIGLAAQGHDALLEGMREHQERTAKPEYVPPPRTARQMAQLEAELNAGRGTQQKAEAQQVARPPDERNRNEGLTTPVHRPPDFVPGLFSKDPAIG